MAAVTHPLEPLTAAEVVRAVAALRASGQSLSHHTVRIGFAQGAGESVRPRFHGG